MRLCVRVRRVLTGLLCLLEELPADLLQDHGLRHTRVRQTDVSPCYPGNHLFRISTQCAHLRLRLSGGARGLARCAWRALTLRLGPRGAWASARAGAGERRHRVGRERWGQGLGSLHRHNTQLLQLPVQIRYSDVLKVLNSYARARECVHAQPGAGACVRSACACLCLWLVLHFSSLPRQRTCLLGMESSDLTFFMPGPAAWPTAWPGLPCGGLRCEMMYLWRVAAAPDTAGQARGERPEAGHEQRQ